MSLRIYSIEKRGQFFLNEKMLDGRVWRRRRGKWWYHNLKNRKKIILKVKKRSGRSAQGAAAQTLNLGLLGMSSWPNIYGGQNSCFPRTGMSKLFHGPKSQQIQCKSESSNSQYEERNRSKWLLCSRVPTSTDYESLSCQAYTHGVTFQIQQHYKRILLGWGNFAVANLKFHI